MNILKQASEEWEVVPEPVARWCNVQQSSGDDCEVKEGEKKSDVPLISYSVSDVISESSEELQELLVATVN